ncbi:translation initiation factor IF-2 [Pseudonocardia sp. TMWB2A]|uniref:translation initiation factor IF-2 n=1 Tax=Pseudonocardia sp. TMWB2A TaxID=687430 RepID=UPI00307D958D
MTTRKTAKTERAVRDHAEAIAAARDRLDADLAERRRREDEAFARYARADRDAEQIVADRDAVIADLERRRRDAEGEAETRLGEVEVRKREILAELHRDGRKAEDLAAMFELPLKRVRGHLRQARRASAATDSPTVSAPPKPSATTSDNAATA